MRPPLLMHLVFHPRSDRARQLARGIHRMMNDATPGSGLHIPTVFCEEDGNGSPPRLPSWTDADRNIVVVLAEDEMVVDTPWCAFVGDLRAACSGRPKDRFFPIQLTENAWPLDPRLESTSFARAYLSNTDEERLSFIERRLMIGVIAALQDVALTDPDRAPVKLFLSHAKQDLHNDPKIAQRLLNHLTIDQPVGGFFDSGSIEAGDDFEFRIEQGIAESTVVCVLTDSFGTRTWCRREVLLAKQKQRPIIVVDGLVKGEVRGFPYLGNVPRVSGSLAASAIVAAALRETLRVAHAEVMLARLKDPKLDRVFVRAPELVTVVGLPDESTVLYPDPPVSSEEQQLIERAQVLIATPLERSSADRVLKDRRIALSMSESTDIQRYGFDPLHLDAAILEISRYLLVKGAALSYGGHLGSEGYTQQLFELVRSHNAQSTLPPVERIRNYLGWPLSNPSVDVRAKFKSTATLICSDRPEGIDESLDPSFVAKPTTFIPATPSPKHRYAWARGMTAMRESQTRDSRARVVLGGVYGPTFGIAPDGTKTTKWYAGRIPGVLEEVYLSLRAKQPIFLIGAYGGAARLIFDVIRGIDRPEMTWQFQRAAPFSEEIRALYQERGEPWIDYPQIVTELRAAGLAGINPLLSEQEHLELATTRSVDTMIELLLRGLGQLAA